MRKREIERSLNERISRYQRNIREIKQDLRRIAQLNIRNANYEIELEEEVFEEDKHIHRPTRTNTAYKGSLADAIKAGERYFAEELGVDVLELRDKSIKYTAQIKVGKRFYYVPDRAIERILERKNHSRE